mgnify:CR=1 FL=1
MTTAAASSFTGSRGVGDGDGATLLFGRGVGEVTCGFGDFCAERATRELDDQIHKESATSRKTINLMMPTLLAII